MSGRVYNFRSRRDQLRKKTSKGWLLLYKGGEYFNENLYYLTGLDSFYTLALISLETDEEFVLTNRYEFHTVHDLTDVADVRVHSTDEFIDELNKVISLKKISLLWCDYNLESRTPLPAEILDRLRRVNPKLKISGLPKELLRMRMIKEPGELELIRKGIGVIHRLFDELPQHIKPGVAEANIEACIHNDLVRNGFNLFYDVFVASGVNSATLLYRTNGDILPADHVVVIDICVAIHNYVIDITRTFSTSEKFPRKMEQYYSVIKRVQQQAIDSVRSGITLQQLSDQARISFQNEGLDHFYMNKIGHFLGLAPDDPGNQDTPLEKGMVITIEPGLYFPEEGYGLRIEDTIFVER